jgi:hypothetical protein
MLSARVSGWVNMYIGSSSGIEIRGSVLAGCGCPVLDRNPSMCGDATDRSVAGKGPKVPQLAG